MTSLWTVETRLYQREGRRPARLRREDLDELAKGIVAVIRKRATVSLVSGRNVPAVVILGKEYNIQILKEDWVKILPFFQNGTFDPKITRTTSCVTYLDQRAAFSESVVDQADKYLYIRVLGQLKLLFTDEYPTAT